MKLNFFESNFRFLFISFWIIIWYKWIVLSNPQVEIIMSNSFIFLSIIYIIIFTIFYKKHHIDKIIFRYRISILISFIFSCISFLLFPTNLFLLNLKTLFTIISIYISYNMLFKCKIEEGLVGIISSILLLVITFLY